MFSNKTPFPWIVIEIHKKEPILHFSFFDAKSNLDELWDVKVVAVDWSDCNFIL